MPQHTSEAVHACMKVHARELDQLVNAPVLDRLAVEELLSSAARDMAKIRTAEALAMATDRKSHRPEVDEILNRHLQRPRPTSAFVPNAYLRAAR